MLSDDANIGNTSAAEAAAAAYVDNDWAEQFPEGANTSEELKPKVSGDTVPQFNSYVFHVEGAKGQLTKGAAKSPIARIYGSIVDGPEGTVGERVFDDLFLRAAKTYQKDGVTFEKDAADYAEDVEALRLKLNKIARIGKFAKAYPTLFEGSTEQKAAGYAAQFGFGGGFDVIVEIREQTDTYNGVTRTKNRIIWESARALDEPAHSKKAKPGTSALDEAREQIAAVNKAIASRNAGNGRTAASVSRKPGQLE